MNRPRITKETLKELRGRLLAEQNGQTQAKNTQSKVDELTDVNNVGKQSIDKNHEQEMDM